jgi:excisionase family DNA binding protein
MNEILLNGINVEQLLEKIGKLLDSKLKEAEPLSKNQSFFLSRAEVSNLLKISLPTLHDWTKQGWLQSYKIGNRVLYKLQEVEEALKKVSINKHKKNIL